MGSCQSWNRFRKDHRASRVRIETDFCLLKLLVETRIDSKAEVRHYGCLLSNLTFALNPVAQRDRTTKLQSFVAASIPPALKTRTKVEPYSIPSPMRHLLSCTSVLGHPIPSPILSYD